MPIEIVVPRLGWSMDEGTFSEWLKKDGEQVNAGDMIFVLEGEKASQEIESFDSGILHLPADTPQPGDTVAVGQTLGYLLAEGEAIPARSNSSADSMTRSVSKLAGAKRVGGPAARRRARELGVDVSALQAADSETRATIDDRQRTETHPPTNALSRRIGSRVAVTPRARRKARELGVDWSSVSGSGRNGRIRERDVLAFAKHAQPDAAGADLSTALGTQQPASRIRRTIAQRMLAGVQQTAPVTLTTKVDATELVGLREQRKAESAWNGVPSYNDILVKLVAAALPECPELNACWRNNGVFTYDEINIAVAVDIEGGLVAPVIKNANSLLLDEIAKQSHSLAEQARTGTLSQNQLEGGTFTITNLGMFDIDFFTPIINLPQSAILGVGRIVREPVVRDNTVVPGDVLGLSLTFDHRAIDGATAAKWLQHLCKLIAQPSRHMTDAAK